MKGIFNKLILSTALAIGSVVTVGLSTTSYAAPAIDIQSVLQQERAWKPNV